MKGRKPSLLSNEMKCYKRSCKCERNLELHHIFFGTANRRISDRYGAYCYLCKDHHTGTDGVHGKHGHELDMELKKECQKAWESKYGSREEFRAIFGKSYLEE